MTNESKKIVNWAAAQSNGHGAHISALTDAINSGRVSDSVVEELKITRKEWTQHNQTGPQGPQQRARRWHTS